MKNIKFYIKLICIAMVLLSGVLFSGCYAPSPLYGKWADNKGDVIQFMNDGTFNASILGSDNRPVNYSGEFIMLDNVIVFYVQSPQLNQINAIWDLDGSIMYITWTRDTTVILTLYHISK